MWEMRNMCYSNSMTPTTNCNLPRPIPIKDARIISRTIRLLLYQHSIAMLVMWWNNCKRRSTKSFEPTRVYCGYNWISCTWYRTIYSKPEVQEFIDFHGTYYRLIALNIYHKNYEHYEILGNDYFLKAVEFRGHWLYQNNLGRVKKVIPDHYDILVKEWDLKD